MDRIWQWAWDRHGARYTWVAFAITVVLGGPTFLGWSFVVVAFEKSDRYVEAAVVALLGMLVLQYLVVLPGLGGLRLAERWAAGGEVDAAKALEQTYTFARGCAARAVGVTAVWAALLFGGVGAMAGASGSRLVQFAILGALMGGVAQLASVHSYVEGALRPVRAAIAGDTGIGDALPRSRPTFAAWANVSMLSVAFTNAATAAIVAVVFVRVVDAPVLAIGIACVLLIGFTMPVSVGAIFAPSLRPIRDLAEGTERVAAGDYSRRLPVVQDDDLGALAASFNRMQAGLAERQRLQGAFGTYVDPVLAARLLQQGDDVFTGERREVSVMFVDVRDFTPFAEANSAEDTVARLNALFQIVVPAVVEAGGHVNKFLGDGALAVFGAPNHLADHADAAVNTAVLIHRRVAERFGGELRIGIGINTGPVIAGTIGGGGKLEFTLIGDAVNVAARVEQLTKTIGDAVLLTHQTVDALRAPPMGLTDRGFHALKGKSAEVQVFGIDPAAATTS
ncbi:adenylate/guanylate cyclase domain-containing protein [Mycobacterium colombiense]|uniref:Adenylate/guanylate cyclase domain-containing protein n=1 Tax=Mycobacterium colombiense TaxID=339268 RepID=A0A329K5F9_9MYCO|nr:adenylate/guanylate cyclase domain-containing protein [Mycobacterium colombiense]RAU90523.1 adenylate/guanylate cyclase domain-containing protein [Mycobacterium colombiense]